MQAASSGSSPPTGDAGTSGDGQVGCAFGTSCVAADDLAPPDAADGYQIVTPPGQYTVQPGQEILPNYCVTLPNTSEFDVGTVQSWMTAGSSHDLFVSYGQPDDPGQNSGCSLPNGTWLHAASIAGDIVELKMPDGVGAPLKAGTQIMLSMHFINTGSSAEQPQVKLNLLRASNYKYPAGAMVSFNTAIDVPAPAIVGVGSQTVSGTCTAPPGSNVFLAGTLTHSHATSAEIDFVSGGQSTTLVDSKDWQNPDVALWQGPFLSVQSGDTFRYSCSYFNNGTSAITVGESMANEVCMTISYFFPAGTTTCD